MAAAGVTNKEQCTVLISSCDAYRDLWAPFFTILSRTWPDRPFPLALSTESAEYPGVHGLHPMNPGAAWTRRLQQAAAALDTPYVLLLLDDFFFTDFVDTARVLQCLDWMEQDAGCAVFSFYPTTGNEPAPYPGFERRPQHGLYRFNAQAALWRRSRLMEFLDADENAWEWENAGNKRSFDVPDAFYSESESKRRIFPYDYMKHGLIGGKWFPQTAELFRKYGVEADFSCRGFYDPKKWMLLPSVASAFQLDSQLYLDTGRGFSETQSLFAPVQKAGAFRQQYVLDGAIKRMRWDPSTHKGFALAKLCFRLYGRGGWKSILPCGGNGRKAACAEESDLLLFLEDDPQIQLGNSGGADLLEITGIAICPITEKMLDGAAADTQQAPRKKWFAGIF